MGRRGLVIVLLLFLAAFVYIAYNSYDTRRSATNGDVFSHDLPSPPPAVTSQDSATHPPTTQQPIVLPSTDTQTANNGSQAASSNAETFGPNPPNGVVSSGNGRFQLYRQGNLTYRFNTDTGQSCILFATDEEWQKPKVYNAGCGIH